MDDLDRLLVAGRESERLIEYAVVEVQERVMVVVSWSRE